MAALAMAAGAVISCLASFAQAQERAAKAPLISRPSPPPPAAPQSLLFVQDLFDVTGAGALDLGELDTVLAPFRRDFDDGLERLPLELTVDAAGKVIGCAVHGPPRLALAGQALCAHALANGRFAPNPVLVLDYTAATYRLTVRRSSDRARAGAPEFHASTGFPYQGLAVRFGLIDLPPVEEGISLSDVQLAGLEYPTAALREGPEGRVEVLITFNQAGRVETCRPIRSDNTARLAYETCYEVRRVARLSNPPDSRPFAFATRWVLAE
ncbi:energy transducer TonB [Alteraurantiacibacter palmitatis]|uniref:Energy transducer TonB n=1 Tax=Alteraurantiacibacter palmitatis TaxID=2054628 RepID=A0ABV7E451_9SPHN